MGKVGLRARWSWCWHEWPQLWQRLPRQWWHWTQDHHSWDVWWRDPGMGRVLYLCFGLQSCDALKMEAECPFETITTQVSQARRLWYVIGIVNKTLPRSNWLTQSISPLILPLYTSVHFLLPFTLPWRWRQDGPLKHCCPS